MTWANNADPDNGTEQIWVTHRLLTECSIKIWLTMKNTTQQPVKLVRVGNSILLKWVNKCMSSWTILAKKQMDTVFKQIWDSTRFFVLITSANRECSCKPAHASNLPRAFTACIRTLIKSVYQKKKKNLISQPKHMLWVLKRPISMRRFFWAPKRWVRKYLLFYAQKLCLSKPVMYK